jgi:hypothetical protein
MYGIGNKRRREIEQKEEREDTSVVCWDMYGPNIVHD